MVFKIRQAKPEEALCLTKEERKMARKRFFKRRMKMLPIKLDLFFPISLNNSFSFPFLSLHGDHNACLKTPIMNMQLE